MRNTKWALVTDPAFERLAIVVDENGDEAIDATFVKGRPLDYRKGLLVASAPELFEALNEVDSAITALDPEDKSTLANLQAAQERARAILKKASGG